MDTVWKPREDSAIEPLDTLIRAARRFIPSVQRAAQEGSGAFVKSFTLDLGEWGERAEVTLNGSVGRRARFAGRDVVAYVFGGAINGTAPARRFSGEALLDLDTGAVLDMTFDTVPPARV